jgi:hypothetical protein
MAKCRYLADWNAARGEAVGRYSDRSIVHYVVKIPVWARSAEIGLP